MSDGDDEFRVRLGRIGDPRGRKAVGYVKRVRRIVAKAGAGRQHQSSAFTGSRIGRGHAQGTVSASQRRAGARRVVIKARIVRIKAGDNGAVRAHLRYVQRDGVTREGDPGELYDASSDRADGKAFAERGAQDRHQFRFIVAPEDSNELADLKPFVRDLMQQMESDLGTKLDWVAADHFNTGYPHSHIVVRGKDDRGQDLVIARDYIAHGMRTRASELITRELGPESELDQWRKLEREVGAEHFTRLDRALLRDLSAGVFTLSTKPERDPRQHALRIGRLRTLERLGLADEAAPGRWRVARDIEPTLRRMGERGDIIKTMHRELKAAGLDRAAGDHAIFDPQRGVRVVGRLVAEGFSDELGERRYAIVDGIDGRTHYVDLGVRHVDDEALVRNTIVELRARDVAPRPADRTIAEIASRHRGIYSIDRHRDADPRVSVEFAQTHVRRLEAMRRQGLADRLPDGSWKVGPDHLDRAMRFEETNRSLRPARMTVLSWQELEGLPNAVGATWLDRQLVGKVPETLASTGLGSEVGVALQARRQWLLDQGFAREQGSRVVYARNLLQALESRELAETAARIARETGLGYSEIKSGDRLTGTYRRTLTLNSGRFALIERAHDFSLVPWRPVLERAKGQVVTGAVGGEGISWTIGIKRGMGR
ncbi:conjugal transfer protein TraI [Bradyrhizobium sp. CCBAU 051011]|uniref:relaxase/mobilization nuclease RlxS n=1 Tax=Bradyrhizobium sp. CCBAU 051011 TaxID=858422 RepID=UPI0013738AD8|nr:relaxase/mobilization nuclease RlxS [Bradyrhizobium sp. CCBAU 051011]QHO79362.1 conjugal transfer protein TraI [Bradyrhizobium sp. CCBAU 051011]